MKRFVLILLVASLALTSGIALAADGSSNVYQGYTFDFFGNTKSTPSPFILKQVITSENLKGIKLDRVDDVCTSEDGRIFLVDKSQSRIHVLDSEGKWLKSLKQLKGADGKNFLDANGKPVTLTSPEGVFYHEKAQELYVADTGAQRVLVLDGTDTKNYAVKRVISAPEGMTGATEFKPSKITVDNADRIYVVVQSSYEGIIELNEDGSFSRYFGVNEPTINLLDYFWKSISTDAQKEKMGKTYAPAFSNVALDGEGFVMAVTSDTAATASVFRLNFQGKNVLRQMGNTPVVGDTHTESDSQFVDIAVKPYGTYAVVDKTYGHVFLYNFDGELLSVFGTKGNLKGELKNPTAICWLGDNLIIGDGDLKCAYVLEPSEFGQALLDANEAYYYGRWDEATEQFQKVLRLCNNLETAYTGIGKNLLMQEKYEDAMYYFKLGNNHDFYSRAYKGHRSIVMRDNFWVIAVIAVALIGAVIWSEAAYHRKQRRLNK